MARRVTPEDIKLINIEYLDCHSYAETARRTGWSASTVKNYIDPKFNLIDESKIHRFNPDVDMPKDDNYLIPFRGLDNYADLCKLSDKEFNEIKALWEEILV